MFRGPLESRTGGKPKVVMDTSIPALLGKDPVEGFINNFLLYTSLNCSRETNLNSFMGI